MVRRLVVPEELGAVEVRLLHWYKNEGDAVAEQEALLEFETDKAIVLVTATHGGVVRKCFCGAGDWLKPGDVAAWVSDSADEALPSDRSAPLEALPAGFEQT
jgi:pyruvate/2-oxoglutarate dehydrogenase complex dihydrolipoamide acyltransferase (E2) component